MKNAVSHTVLMAAFLVGGAASLPRLALAQATPLPPQTTQTEQAQLKREETANKQQAKAEKDKRKALKQQEKAAKADKKAGTVPPPQN